MEVSINLTDKEINNKKHTKEESFQTHTKKKRPFLTILFIFLVLIIGSGLYFGYKGYMTGKGIGLNLSPSDLIGKQKEPELKKDNTGVYTNILIVGIDTRTKLKTLNTDVIIVASYNHKTKDVVMISIPRDFRTKVNPSKTSYGKINSAYSIYEAKEKGSGLEGLKGIVEEIKQDLSNNPNSKILESIREVISDKLVVSEINADAAYYYEIDDEWVELNEISILTENSELRVHIVDKGSDTITVNIACEVCCRVGATFDFSIWDSVDKEYIRLGSSQEIVEQVYETNVLVSLSGNFLNGLSDMEIDDIEVDNTLGSVEMGEIQPFENDESYYQ